MAHGILQCANPLSVISTYPSHLLFSSMEQNALKRNGTHSPPSGPAITQPDSLLVVRFDYLNFYQSYNMEFSRVFFSIITLLALIPRIMGVDMESSRIMVVKKGRSASEWHTFHASTSINEILVPLQKYLYL